MPKSAAGLQDGMPFSIGETIAGKYEVLRILGRGGVGVVVEARHRVLDQSVAIKFLRPEFSAHATLGARFLREARAACRLRGENVIRLMDADRLDSGLPYIVMEYLRGSSVAETLLERKRLPEQEAVDIVLQAGLGIAEAHAIGIIHRDIKPANLFITAGPDGLPLVKVLDFGISKLLDAGAERSITQKGHLLGSPRYMSPEQMRSPGQVDGRTDIWSLGVVLYELLRGRVPFPGKSALAIFAESMSPPELVRFRPEISPKLEAVIHRCLARQKDERYSSIAELAGELLSFGSPRAAGWAHRTALMLDVPAA